MSIIPAGVFNEDITIYPYLGDTPVGPSWGDGVAAKAYVEPSAKLIVSDLGEQVIASHFMAMGYSVAIEAGYKVVFGALTMRVLTSSALKLVKTPCHKECYLQVMV